MPTFWLSKRMADINLSQKELARRYGNAQSTVSTWIKSETVPINIDNQEDMLRLADALEWTLEEMLMASAPALVIMHQTELGNIDQWILAIITMMQNSGNEETNRAIYEAITVFHKHLTDPDPLNSK